MLFPACYRNSNINEIMERESLRVVRDGLLRLKFDPVRPTACLEGKERCQGRYFLLTWLPCDGWQ
jgi:hypothetical protein